MNVEIVKHGSALHLLVNDLRERVLRQPLGLKLNEADLKIKPDTLIFAAIENGKPVACCMLECLHDDRVKLRQMAVDPLFQKQGLGAMLLSHAEKYAQSKGWKFLEMHARMSAVDFYKKLGYEAKGDVFEEMTLPHIEMWKKIS